MGRVQRALGLAIVFVSVGFASGDPTTQLYSALDRQENWLTQSSEGVVWQQYLQTPQLREALAAPSLDRRFLASVLGRYNSNAPGLTEGPFVSTRNALSNLANQAQVPMALRWAEQLRASAPFEAPFTDQAVRDAKYELVDATSALNSFLSQGGYDTQQGWKSFLNWNDLESQLRSDQPDWKALDGVQRKFIDGYPGLEYPPFVRVREALQKYSYVGKLAEGDGGIQSINQYTNALADAIEKYNDEPTTKNAAGLAAILDWLGKIDRDQGLATEVRSAHSRPNLRLRISERFLAKRFYQPIHDSMYVNEMILNTHVRGTATTNGSITADVVPNANGARIDIVFNGNTDTVSVGRQEPVTIRSRSATSLFARKSLFLYPTRIESGPARASGATNTKINSITPDRKLGRRIVEKIAWKKAGEQKPQTEAIAASRAADRLEKKIDEQTQTLLDNARADLNKQYRGEIGQRGLIPEHITTSSLENCVLVHGTQADSSQLSATTDPPSFCLDGDVVAQVHESAVNNTVEKAIAGMTLTDERIVKMMTEMKMEIPAELQIGEDDQPWSISFAWNQPVTVEFDNQMLKVSVRGRRFTRGERVLNKVMEMSATYTMQTLPTGVELTRQGDVEVTFPTNKEGAQLRASDVVFKTLMEQKFSQLFKPFIKGDGFVLPGEFGSMGRIRLNELSTQDGWLSLGWQ